jgi:predicted naringenin-chalcone synthase
MTTVTPSDTDAAILGLGLARPAGRIEAADAARHAAARCGPDPAVRQRVLKLAERAGIHRRASVIADELESFHPPGDDGAGTAARMSAYERHAPPLAHAAASRALRSAGTAAAACTHLVLVSCTGFASPGVDHAIMRSLGLDPGIQRTVVGFMGCHGMLNGLRVAALTVRAEPEARVLVVAVELCSLHFAYGPHPQRIVANTLFADGAAAVLVGRAGGSDADDSPNRLGIRDHGSHVIADTSGEMSWRIGDDGFLMTLEPSVPQTIRRHLGPWMDAWLAARGLRRADVGGWIVHPGGPRILTAVEDALDLDAEALSCSRHVLSRCGNMSSPTVFFALRRMLRRTPRPGPIIMLGLGPGLSIEAALLD